MPNDACEPQEAIQRLVRDLRDGAGGHSIDERIPVIVAEMVKFRDKVEQMVRVLV